MWGTNMANTITKMFILIIISVHKVYITGVLPCVYLICLHTGVAHTINKHMGTHESILLPVASIIQPMVSSHSTYARDTYQCEKL